MSIDKTARTLVGALKQKELPKPFDTTATVTRVDGDTLWVHIPGGVDETPVKKTIAASEGDEVQVRVSGGSAWVTGNASAPPTDDTAVIKEAEVRKEEILKEKEAREIALSALAAAMQSKSGLYETTTTATGGGTIFNLHDRPDLTDSTLVIRLTADALGISLDGGSTWSSGFNFATETAIVSILQANGIDADWINAGKISVNYVDFTDRATGISVPDENDPSTLFSGQSVVNGWIVDSNAEHTQCDGYCTGIHGDLTVSLVSHDPVSGGEVYFEWEDPDDPETIYGQEIIWEEAAMGQMSADGTLTGGTYEADADGKWYKYSHTFAVPNRSARVRVHFGTSRFRQVVVQDSMGDQFVLGYANNVRIGSAGLQVGKFVVDKAGNATANGLLTVTGELSASLLQYRDITYTLPASAAGTWNYVNATTAGTALPVPSGYHFLCVSLTGGSTVDARNGVYSVGLTANRARIHYYTASAIAAGATITVRVWFIRDSVGAASS